MEGRAAGLPPIYNCKSLHTFRPTLLVLLTLGHDGGTKAGAKVIGQFIQLRVAIDLNGFLRGITNDVAVMAPGKMILQLDFCRFVEDAIQIIR
jgi:hypothetical protein